MAFFLRPKLAKKMSHAHLRAAQILYLDMRLPKEVMERQTGGRNTGAINIQEEGQLLGRSIKLAVAENSAKAGSRGRRQDRYQLQSVAKQGAKWAIPAVPVRMAERRVGPMKNRFTTSQTGQMGIQWCRFQGEKGNSREKQPTHSWDLAVAPKPDCPGRSGRLCPLRI